MKICVIIPLYNEELYLEKTLDSFINQIQNVDKLILVNDNSSDNTNSIAKNYSKKYDWIELVQNNSANKHIPGKKVINAFYNGLETISKNDYELIGKFDGDIELPPIYFKRIREMFSENKSVGIAGGNLYIHDKGKWIFENISNKKKVRGPIKTYRKECFDDIGGLKKSIGWDTVDELLAQYHGWQICTDESLHVKHLKPTGNTYTKASRHKQGEAFYKLRYGVVLTIIASAKLSYKKRSFDYFIDCLRGYAKAKNSAVEPIVSKKEGSFIRKLRWTGIKKKIL
ncbi:glycosyltransferase [Marixanthomonas spongiae]|uniref:Glycosyl transferase family 2 n=1 Tax=Marixanthomonas spongiae TaxID=2174845 RepID=A0A2U0HWS7_9FLAO|nr:glycosyltransferase [Marixanthomonas spongiae]PVW13315.1 glycosyl transferase family 2 [Marixanthomonas spongiae]